MCNKLISMIVLLGGLFGSTVVSAAPEMFTVTGKVTQVQLAGDFGITYFVLDPMPANVTVGSFSVLGDTKDQAGTDCDKTGTPDILNRITSSLMALKINGADVEVRYCLKPSGADPTKDIGMVTVVGGYVKMK